MNKDLRNSNINLVFVFLGDMRSIPYMTMGPLSFIPLMKIGLHL